MAFEPLDWLTTAARLGTDTRDEASRRTAAGRLYYAVWLKSLLSLEARQLYTRNQSRDDHSGVIRVLKQNRRVTVGESLQRLSRLRERADYDEQSPFTEADLDRARTLANEVRRLRPATGASWSRHRPRLRGDHLTLSHLRLPVFRAEAILPLREVHGHALAFPHLAAQHSPGQLVLDSALDDSP